MLFQVLEIEEDNVRTVPSTCQPAVDTPIVGLNIKAADLSPKVQAVTRDLEAAAPSQGEKNAQCSLFLLIFNSCTLQRVTNIYCLIVIPESLAATLKGLKLKGNSRKTKKKVGL